ncbi:MAG TPA: LuxR family transcriptional regulator [Rhizomicrobium sp.]
MHRVLQGYLDNLDNAGNHNQLRDAMTAMASGMGLHSYAYLSTPTTPSKKPRLISTYAEAWTTYYLDRRYETSDPVILRAYREFEPFDWGPDLADTRDCRATRDFFEEAANFGVRYGFTIPIHHWRGGHAAVTFAAGRRSADYRKSIRHNARALQLIAYHFHAHVLHMVEPGFLIDEVSLSLRQTQCLELAAKGKSVADIAQLLGITRATAAYHLDCAKAKFGVRTICQAAIAYAALKRKA